MSNKSSDFLVSNKFVIFPAKFPMPYMACLCRLVQFRLMAVYSLLLARVYSADFEVSPDHFRSSHKAVCCHEGIHSYGPITHLFSWEERGNGPGDLAQVCCPHKC